MPIEIFRDDSLPSFTAEHPHGRHAAWRFRLVGTEYGAYDGGEWGPYMTRADAAASAETLAARAIEREQECSAARLAAVPRPEVTLPLDGLGSPLPERDPARPPGPSSPS